MRIPGPSDILGAVAAGYHALDRAFGLLPRLGGLVSDAETLLSTVRQVAEGVDAMMSRAEALLSRAASIADGGDALVVRAVGIADGVDAVRSRADVTVDDIRAAEESARVLLREAEGLLQRANALVGSAGALTSAVEPLLGRLQPTLLELQPVLARIASAAGPGEIAAVVDLLHVLPSIVDKLDADILPVVDTLATVAPDLRDLLDICKELSELIGSVPGLSRVKKKIEDSDWQDEYRALEEPQAAPERRPTTPDSIAGVADDGVVVLSSPTT